MYILKYILKNCHQHSYGFQNLMSSGGCGSKLSNSELVICLFETPRMFYCDGTDGRTGRTDGWDGRSTKVSFNFLHTLCEFRTCMYILKYILKNCHQHSYGFQNLMSSWGSWSKISKLEQVGDFFFWSKSSLLVSKISFNYVYTLRVHR